MLVTADTHACHGRDEMTCKASMNNYKGKVRELGLHSEGHIDTKKGYGIHSVIRAYVVAFMQYVDLQNNGGMIRIKNFEYLLVCYLLSKELFRSHFDFFDGLFSFFHGK